MKKQYGVQAALFTAVACFLMAPMPAFAETFFSFSFNDAPHHRPSHAHRPPLSRAHGPHFHHHHFPHYRPVWHPAPRVVYQPIVVQPVRYVEETALLADPVSAPFYNDRGQTCREYQTTARIGGLIQAAYGTACRGADGSWRVVD